MAIGRSIAAGGLTASGLGLPAGASTGGAQDYAVLASTGIALQQSGRCDLARPRLELAIGALGVSRRSRGAWASWFECEALAASSSSHSYRWVSERMAGLTDGDEEAAPLHGDVVWNSSRLGSIASKAASSLAEAAIRAASGTKALIESELDSQALSHGETFVRFASHGGDLGRAGGGDRSTNARLSRGQSIVKQVMRKGGMDSSGFADEDEDDFESLSFSTEENEDAVEHADAGSSPGRVHRRKLQPLQSTEVADALLVSAEGLRQNYPAEAAALFAAHLQVVGNSSGHILTPNDGLDSELQTEIRRRPECQTEPHLGDLFPGLRDVLTGGAVAGLASESESVLPGETHRGGGRGSAYELGRSLREAGLPCAEAIGVVAPMVKAGMWPSAWQRPALVVGLDGRKLNTHGSAALPAAAWPLEAATGAVVGWPAWRNSTQFGAVAALTGNRPGPGCMTESISEAGPVNPAFCEWSVADSASASASASDSDMGSAASRGRETDTESSHVQP